MTNRALQTLKLFYNAFVLKSPVYLILYVTARCNARCKMCFYWKAIENSDLKKELTLEEIEKLSKQMNKLIQLSIGGGEPTLRADLDQICYLFSRNNDVRFITLPTNGINTAQVVERVESVLSKCQDTHLRLSLSLDGFPEIHEEIRGIKGCYAKVMDTYNELKKLKRSYSNLSVDIVTVLQALNEQSILDFFKMINREIKPDNHMVLLTRGNVREREAKEVSQDIYRAVIDLKREYYIGSETRPFSAIIRALTERSLNAILNDYTYDKFQIPCVAGKRLVVISELGEVRPCEILDDSFGNLQDYDYNLGKLLESKKAIDLLTWIKEEKCHCTFECAVNISVFYDWKGYFDLLYRTLKIRLRTNN